MCQSVFIDITGINLFDQFVGMVYAKVRRRLLMDIIGIDLFDHNMSMASAKVRLRCSWISLVLIYLIKMWY